MPIIKKIISEPHKRQAEIIKSAINIEARTVEIAFSSEIKVKRWFGYEILDHAANAVDLTRLNDKAQYLFNHDIDRPIGVVERAWIDSDKKGRALVRYSKSADADKIFLDVCDGIINHVSVGYHVNSMVLDSTDKNEETYRITSWEPYELSQVTIPADSTVGVGRSLDLSQDADKNNNSESKIIVVSNELPNERGAKMDEETKQKLINEGITLENKRMAEISKLASENGCEHLVRQAIETKQTTSEFMHQILSKTSMRTQELAGRGEVFGIPKKELRQFSMLRAMNYLENGNRSEAAFEVEFSEHMQKTLNRKSGGLLVPTQLMNRAFSTAENSGKGIVQDTLSFTDFIPMLKEQTVLSRLGARWLTGLIGSFSIPKQTKGSTTYWLEEGKPVSMSEFQTGQTKLSPRTVGAAVDITRKLLLQTSMDVENFIIQDLTEKLALEIDRVAICGKSDANSPSQPTGILNLPNVFRFDAISENKGGCTYADCVKLYSKIASNNIIGNTSYLTNALVSQILKTNPMFPSGSIPIWQTGNVGYEGMVAGSKAFESNLVPTDMVSGENKNLSALIYGRFSDVLIGEWGVLDLQRDPYANGLSGDLRIRALLDVDVAVRYEEAFAVRTNIKTQ